MVKEFQRKIPRGSLQLTAYLDQSAGWISTVFSSWPKNTNTEREIPHQIVPPRPCATSTVPESFALNNRTLEVLVQKSNRTWRPCVGSIP